MNASSYICDFVRTLEIGDNFTSRELWELIDDPEVSYAAVSACLHRLTRAEALKITCKTTRDGQRRSYLFEVVDPQLISPSSLRRQRPRRGVREDFNPRMPLFQEEEAR